VHGGPHPHAFFLPSAAWQSRPVTPPQLGLDDRIIVTDTSLQE
jgi:hypothetical protein